MRISEFIQFINSPIKPKARDITFDYTRMTINDKIDSIRKEMRRRSKNATSK